MKMGTTCSPFPYDPAICKAATPYDFALRLAELPSILGVVRLPFDNGPLDQSRDRRDGPHSDVASYPGTTIGITKDQAEAAIRAVTRLRICGSRNALGGLTRWVTSLMI